MIDDKRKELNYKEKNLAFIYATPHVLEPIWDTGIHDIFIPCPSVLDFSSYQPWQRILCTPDGKSQNMFPKTIRLKTSLYLTSGPTCQPNAKESSKVEFEFISSNVTFYMDQLKEADMQKYYDDLRFILYNEYGFNNLKHSIRQYGNQFYFNFNSDNYRYWLEEFQLILYMYKNPVEFKNNSLQVNKSYSNSDYIYSVQAENVTIFFNIDILGNNTYCVVEFYWLRSDRLIFDKEQSKPFPRTALIRELNYHLCGELTTKRYSKFVNLMCKDPNYTGEEEELPMVFKRYHEGLYEGFRSKCYFHDNEYVKRYLHSQLIQKLCYCSYWDADLELNSFFRVDNGWYV